MVETSIGVLGLQGAVSEHVAMMQQSLKLEGAPGKVTIVRKPQDLITVDALIIPGGESSTISKMMHKFQLDTALKKRLDSKDLFVMGTCAGCVLLSSKLEHPSDDVFLLHVMDMVVERNAFGRQYESFEQAIEFYGLNTRYPAVFIRAPVITKVDGTCKVLAKSGKKIVAARQQQSLALAFHPELSGDPRIHQYFLDMLL